MYSYHGPAILVVEGSDEEVHVAAALTSSTTAGSPSPQWRGLLLSIDPGALWPAYTAGWASLSIEGISGDVRITEYHEPGSCDIEGVGPPPF
jgi:hypothetical protein